MSTADAEFAGLLAYIERSLGFQTSSYNDSYLDRRISARQRRTGAESYVEYLALLKESSDERAALLDTLSVNVTSFFRNPDVWAALREVLAAVAAERRQVSVWSAACSDGREAYSLAMLAHDDPRIDPRAVDVLGTDIKPTILQKAREGVYRASETNDLDSQLAPLGDHAAYVERDDGRCRVSDALREMVTFRSHDLIREGPPGSFDLVLCRNLFIYVDRTAKRAVFETVSAGLEPGGYLTTGMTETVPHACRDWFDPVERRQRIYRHVER